MGDFFIIQTNQKKASSRIEKIFYVHLWDILCTRFFSIPEDALKRNFFQFYILCTSSFLYIYMYVCIVYSRNINQEKSKWFPQCKQKTHGRDSMT